MQFVSKIFFVFLLVVSLPGHSEAVSRRLGQVGEGMTVSPLGSPGVGRSLCGTLLLSDPDFLKEVEENTRRLYPDVWWEIEVIRKAAGEARTFDIGDSTRFFSLDIIERVYFTFSAELRARGNQTDYWVEKREIERGHVTDSEILKILEIMEETTPPASRDPERGTIDIEKEFFGVPPNKDGDGRIDIVVMDIRDGWEPGRGFVAGYFTATDQSDGENSNKRDILYIDTFPGIFSPFSETRQVATIKVTAAHELQHLILYRYDAQEHSWVNEGLSMYAQYLTGFGLEDMVGYLFDTNRNLTSIVIETEGGINNEVIKDYHKVQLFSFYMWEQFGDDVMRRMVQSPRSGVEGVKSALSESGFSISFEDLLTNWALCNYINDRSANTAYGYLDEQASGWRANLHADHFSYPVDPTSETVEGYAFKYYRFSSAESLKVTFNGDAIIVKAILFGFDGVTVQDIASGELFQVDELGTEITNVVIAVINPTLSRKRFTYDATAVQSTQVTELAVDDGEPDVFSEQASFLGFGDNRPGYGWSMRFLPPHPSATLISARIFALSLDGEALEFHIWDDRGFFGSPGRDIMTPISIEPPVVGDGFWWEVNLLPYADQIGFLGESIYVGLVHTGFGSGIYLGMDNSHPDLNRTWAFFGPDNNNSGWFLLDQLGIQTITGQDTSFLPLDRFNMMFRLRTSVDISVVPPSPPRTLVARASDADVLLQWTANNERDMSEYHLYRSTDALFEPSDGDMIGTIRHPETEFTDIDVVGGQSYYYLLTAVDQDSLESLPGPEANATPILPGETYADSRTLALWHFNEGKGGVLFDESINNYDGAIQSPQWIAKGRYGGDLKFDGRFSEVRAPNVDFGGTGDSFTISLWYKLYESFQEEDRTFITQGYRRFAKGKWGIFYDSASGTLRALLEARSGLARTLETEEGLAADGWHHLALVRDADKEFIRLYLDARAVDEADFAGTLNISNTFDTMIGRDAREIDYVFLSNFLGEIDEVVIIDTALTEFDIITAIGAEGSETQIPQTFSLEQNYPNPFNPTTTITFGLPQNGQVRLAVYNVLGQEIRVLRDRKLLAGTYQVVWDGRNSRGIPVPSGIFFYRLQSEGFDVSKKMILLK